MNLRTSLEWIKAWFAGLLVGAFLFLFDKQWVIEKVNLPATGVGFSGVFLKNLLASLSTIYLGLLLCYLELSIYTRVSGGTYAFMERLTDPLYKIVGTLNSRFSELKPFFRSCLFYLLFVPNLSLFLNGAIPGFLFLLEPRALLPHGVLEIPIMLASAKMAFSIKDEMAGAILSADIELLKTGMKRGISRGRLKRVGVIQLVLLVASYVEVTYAF